MSIRFRSALFCVIFLAFCACKENDRIYYTFRKNVLSKEGVIVSAHPLATQAGINVLRNGGNAVDAAVAVHLTLAVVYPRAGNLGGGGFMVYRSGSGESTTLDFREKAPKAAQRDMYLDSLGNIIPGLSREGHLATGVPGTTAGLVTAHEKYGLLPWYELCRRAMFLARDGHHMTRYEADRLNSERDNFLKYNNASIPFVNDSIWREGDLLKQPDLAETLERIAHEGRKGFYSGQTADLIVKEMENGGGLITQTDLDAYEAVWRKPVTTDYDGYRIISVPPPSSGGIALSQLLEIVEPYPLHKWGSRDARTVHLMIEAERRVYADRATYLGDPDFHSVPTENLLDSLYLSSRMADFNPDSATQSMNTSAGNFTMTMESFETTHFTVVDKWGNAVAITTTLNGNYGSKVVVDGAGFFLNNEMDDFSAKPGAPNMFGLIGGEANAIAAEKRMLSSMTPAIIEKNGRLFMTLGTPGGSTIITSVFQSFLNVAEFRMTASEAIASPRFHHQWLPDEVIYEPNCFPDTLLQSLRAKGHRMREVSMIGLVEMIHVLSDSTYVGAADPRESSHALGL